jgi:hypothetical protein
VWIHAEGFRRIPPSCAPSDRPHWEASLSLKHRIDITCAMEHPHHLNTIISGAVEHHVIPDEASEVWSKLRPSSP